MKVSKGLTLIEILIALGLSSIMMWMSIGVFEQYKTNESRLSAKGNLTAGLADTLLALRDPTRCTEAFRSSVGTLPVWTSAGGTTFPVSSLSLVMGSAKRTLLAWGVESGGFTPTVLEVEKLYSFTNPSVMSWSGPSGTQVVSRHVFRLHLKIKWKAEGGAQDYELPGEASPVIFALLRTTAPVGQLVACSTDPLAIAEPLYHPTPTNLIVQAMTGARVVIPTSGSYANQTKSLGPIYSASQPLGWRACALTERWVGCAGCMTYARCRISQNGATGQWELRGEDPQQQGLQCTATCMQ